MPNATAVEQADTKRERESPTYAPSWVDRFTAWVAGLPGPSWPYYLSIGLVVFSLQVAIFWVEGAYPIGTVDPAHSFLAAMIPSLLALIHYLDHKAGAALATLRPALEAREEKYGRLHYRLTTLPARSTLLASLGGMVLVLLAIGLVRRPPSSFQALATFPVSRALTYCMYLATWWVFGAFVYHTIRQLRMVNLVCTRHTRINLFRIRPLYAFSRVTALTAVSLTACNYGWLAINPGMLHDPISLAMGFPFTVLALVTFAWPLVGVHHLLVEEKERQLDEASQRYETTLAALHELVDEGRLDGIGDLNNAIAGLRIELDALEGIPTWPWRPETVRLLVTTLALPLGLWIVQYLLQRLFGP